MTIKTRLAWIQLYELTNDFGLVCRRCGISRPTLRIPIQRIQTDRGSEFFGPEFQAAMKRNRIKFRPIKPRSPHLNGKIERSQMTDKIEFYPTIDITE